MLWKISLELLFLLVVALISPIIVEKIAASEIPYTQPPTTSETNEHEEQQDIPSLREGPVVRRFQNRDGIAVAKERRRLDSICF